LNLKEESIKKRDHSLDLKIALVVIYTTTVYQCVTELKSHPNVLSTTNYSKTHIGMR